MPGLLSDSATPGAGNTYDATGDDRGVANQMRYGEDFALAEAVEIRDTANYDYNIDATGRECTIIVDNGLDQDVTVTIFMRPSVAFAGTSTIYSAARTAGTVATYSKDAGGAGASGHVQVAALTGPAYRFTVRIAAGVNPSSGDVDVYAYCS